MNKNKGFVLSIIDSIDIKVYDNPSSKQETIELYEISEECWENKYKNFKEYNYRKFHDYCQGTFMHLDILICMKCNACSLTKDEYKSCEEKLMNEALK